MSYFDVRIPGLKMTVVAADGQHVEPVSVDELRIAVAETYDVIVEPGGERAYTSSPSPWTAAATPAAPWRWPKGLARRCRRPIRAR